MWERDKEVQPNWLCIAVKQANGVYCIRQRRYYKICVREREGEKQTENNQIGFLELYNRKTGLLPSAKELNWSVEERERERERESERERERERARDRPNSAVEKQKVRETQLRF